MEQNKKEKESKKEESKKVKKKEKKERPMSRKSPSQSLYKISTKKFFVNIKPSYISNFGKMREYISYKWILIAGVKKEEQQLPALKHKQCNTTC